MTCVANVSDGVETNTPHAETKDERESYREVVFSHNCGRH